MESQNKDCTAREDDYAEVVGVLTNMFGLVMDRDAIFSVVESCDGNLNHSIEAMMNIVNDANNQDTDKNTINSPTAVNIQNVTEQNRSTILCPTNSNTINTAQSESHTTAVQTNNTSQDASHVEQINVAIKPTDQSISPISYSSAFKSTGAVPKIKIEPKPSTSHKDKNNSFWTDQIRRIIDYHNKGFKTLILMRGVSGSGKSWLARHIVEVLLGQSEENNYHICSSDDYFYFQGRYVFDGRRIHHAHDWNQKRASELITKGVSPVIIDNTNTELWEMQPYIVCGLREGYYIEIVEPQNPWSKKAYQLAKKSQHNLTVDKIKRQLDKFQPHYSNENYFQMFKIGYPPNKTPPLPRKYPIFIAENLPSDKKEQQQQATAFSHIIGGTNQDNFSVESTSNSTHITNDNEANQATNNDKEINKKLEELEKVAQEWDMGEKWEESTEIPEQKNNQTLIPACKPARFEQDGNRLLPKIDQEQDWKSLTRFMSELDYQPPPTPSKQSKKVIAAKSFGTSIEFGDTDLHIARNKYKIILGQYRDINLHYEPQKEKIPDQRMLDKSTTTNESVVEPCRCQNEKHFIAFRKMFKNIPRADLREIFDKCCGDVNWAVEIVLDGFASNEIPVVDDNNSDTDDMNDEQCSCTAANEIIPDVTIKEQESPKEDHSQIELNQPGNIGHTQGKTIKKESTLSDTSKQIKKQIEQNVVIPDEHYSLFKHCLKIRKIRRGETNDLGTQNEAAASEHDQTLESDTSDCESSLECDETLNVNLGREFLAQLDSLFDRKDMVYPENIVPIVNMPMSLLRKINALWIESLTHQLQSQEFLSKIIYKEDEGIAKQLAEMESKMENTGVEPQVPDFKEIMDMDFALNIYQKDVDEWRSNEPDNMAARLTRDKLKNLFPEISPEILSELLMAHDNNFQATVEVLLMSTGQTEILQKENGVNKFIMEKEISQQEQIMQEERNKIALNEEWPVLGNSDTINRETVDEYRYRAQQHLERRNMSYNKAREAMNRGMTSIAGYYSEVASYHKRKHEEANTMAAISLIQLNSKDRSSVTLDLHWLYVSEALQSLDIFIDFHINLLKENLNNNKGNNRSTLLLITGRGLHSQHGPRIKPAVKRRLRERGLTECVQVNPGVVEVVVSPYDKLTSEIN